MKQPRTKNREFIEKIMVKGKNILSREKRGKTILNAAAVMLLVPIISILIYKIFAEPFYVKKMVENSVVETISHQPELVLKTLRKEFQQETGTMQENGLTGDERNRLMNLMSDRITQNNEAITYSLETLKSDLIYLKEQQPQDQGNPDFEELLDKVQEGTATEQDISMLLNMIESLKSKISSKAEQEELDNLKKLLGEMQEGAVTGGELTEVKDTLGALKEELDKAKKEMNENLAKYYADMEEKIGQVITRIDELEITIEEKHYTKTEIDTKLAAINTAISDLNETVLVTINKKIEEINNDMSSSNSNLKNELEQTRNELNETIDKTKIDLEEKINNISIRINELEVAIEDKHYTKTEIDTIIKDINVSIDDINNNSLVTINTKIDEINNETIVEINQAIDEIKNNSLFTINNQIQEIRNEIGNANTDLTGKIDDILDKIDALEMAIASSHYTKSEIDSMVAAINTAINDINNNRIGNLNGLSTSNKSNLVGSINEVFQSVSDGKRLLASAITDKGINADANESFSNLANKIKMITNSTLVGDIKYTYHTHIEGCYGPCGGTMDLIRSDAIGDGKWNKVYLCRSCKQQSSTTAHNQPMTKPCSYNVNKCGKTESTIEKAEIVFNPSTRSFDTLNIEEVIENNKNEQLKSEKESFDEDVTDELETVTEEASTEELHTGTEEFSTEEGTTKIEKTEGDTETSTDDTTVQESETVPETPSTSENTLEHPDAGEISTEEFSSADIQ